MEDGHTYNHALIEVTPTPDGWSVPHKMFGSFKDLSVREGARDDESTGKASAQLEPIVSLTYSPSFPAMAPFHFALPVSR